MYVGDVVREEAALRIMSREHFSLCERVSAGCADACGPNPWVTCAEREVDSLISQLPNALTTCIDQH